ncbi:MAG: hypothetical protein K8S55_00040 [Phycisphaerae bacterium]|nr:hypothetical protein [Phycisphaerae bacterium]
MNRILVVLLGILVLSPMGCKKAFQSAKAADKTADEILNAIAAGEADMLYDEYTTSACRGAVTRERWSTLINVFRVQLGQPKSWNRTSFNIRTGTGGTTGQFGYNVQWEKDKGTMSLNMHKEGGQWKIHHLQINSDALLKGLGKPSQDNAAEKKLPKTGVVPPT